MTSTKLTLDYGRFEILANELAAQVKATGRVYAGIYGVPRGGVPVALALSHRLGIPLIAHLPCSDDKGLFLIADDICDSGATLRRVNGGSGVGFAALLVKPSANPKPEFHALEVTGWVEFPWELAAEEMPAEDAIIRILQYIGEDVTRDGLRDTPKRVIKSFREIYAGYSMDPAKILERQFECEMPVEEVIISKDIPFTSTCEHHMLPFVGRAHVGYIPAQGGKIVGLSKLARVVDCFALRLQNQERITTQVAHAVQGALSAQAVGVVIESLHSCMSCRGVKKTGSTMVTSCMLGKFKYEPVSRSEFYRLIGK